MARLPTNEEVEKVGDLMVEMLKNDPENLIKDFISEILAEKSKNQAIRGVFFECNERAAQKKLTRVIIYALCYLKLAEKDDLLSQATLP